MSESRHADPGWHIVGMVMVPPEAASVARVRGTVADSLAPRFPQERVDAAVLLTSELVTNVVVHAHTHAAVRVRASGKERLRVEVVDRSPQSPELQDADPSRGNGFGLRLVHELASDWGWLRTGQVKMVWFELHCHGNSMPVG